MELSLGDSDESAESLPLRPLRLHVSPTAEWKLRSGHPWLFSDSIAEQNRRGVTGELAVIYDRHDNFLAIGLYDPESPIRVRVVHKGKPAKIDERFWFERLRASRDRRTSLFDDQTDGYRLIHGENDGWPGLVLDCYGDTFVLKLYSAVWIPRLHEIAGLFARELAPRRLVLRLSRNLQAAARGTAFSDGQVLSGEPLNGPVAFKETGLRFEADVVRGQKTGFFLDQRENRRLVETMARGRAVLNMFSFSGGFSLYAARGGARTVTDIDISEHALANANRNFEVNSDSSAIASCQHHTIKADAFDWIKDRADRFDMIIVDPPSLAKRESERDGAIKAYAHLLFHAIKRLQPGGILVASSCSAHVSADEFFEIVREIARQAGPYKELQTTRQPPDHPAAFPEAQYLKTIYLALPQR